MVTLCARRHLSAFLTRRCFLFWCFQDPNAGRCFEKAFVRALTKVSPEFVDPQLQMRLGHKFDFVTDKPVVHKEEGSSIVFWLGQYPNFPLLDAVLYTVKDGLPSNAVFLQCSLQAPPKHAGTKRKPNPSRPILYGEFWPRARPGCACLLTG